MDILDNIPIFKEGAPLPPVTLEDIQRIHPSLTLDNALTFVIFLSKRPDLEEKEKNIYQQIINRLYENERIKYEAAMKNMVTANLPTYSTPQIE
jgi:hypothetical protein